MGSIGVAELLILGFVGVVGVTIMAATVAVYVVRRKQRQ